MGLPVTIDNPEFIEYYECENERRKQSWVSAGIIAALGLLQIIKYAELYGDVVKKRKEINDLIYQCAMKEFEFWRDYIYPYAMEAFNYIYNLPEIDINYDDPLEDIDMSYIMAGAISYEKRLDDACDACNDPCDNDLAADFVLAQAGAATNLVRNQERRALARKELKMQGMATASRFGKDAAAVGRQMLTIALNIINSLVAMASSGLNAGLNMFGQGLGMLGSAFG